LKEYIYEEYSIDMKHGFESSDNFSNMLEYMNSCQHSSSESINELDTTIEEPVIIHESNISSQKPDPESRSNSVTSDDIDNCTITHEIPIPTPPQRRTRETTYNGMSVRDSYGLTPTPTKHRKFLEETAQNIGSLITKYYEQVEYKLSPYSK